MEPLSEQIENLYQSRYHGAVNIRGIKYQILYSAMRIFDFYNDNPPESICFEGVEDLDINGNQILELNSIRTSNEYIQVKSSINTWYWSTFQREEIIEKFLDVWKVDVAAKFLFVINFDCDNKLSQLMDFCNGITDVFPNKIKSNVQDVFGKKGHKKTTIETFFKRVKIVRISEVELLKEIKAKVVKCFDLQTNNPDIYILAITSSIINWAIKRCKVTKADLEAIKLNIQDEISKGVQNEAVKNGWIEKLEFQKDKYSDDYFEGANARPGHILENLDVDRPLWAKQIKNALNESGTCIIRTASGQGKSTLLYRYAFQNYQRETTFIIKNLSDELMVAPIKQNILARKELGLPILVLIDNVQANLRYWYRLINELIEQNIQFIVTLREEDWFRYSGDAGLFNWKIIKPELSLEEAKQIFNEFKLKNKIADGIESAEQAFERVEERKLLLEFTYLITHGQMLEERLRGQVSKMQTLNEDKAKLLVLRLVSIAQKYEAKISIKNLLKIVSFNNDPNFTLESLRNEYLLFFDEYCEGLHLVRSEHLIEILHSLIPVEETMKELIYALDNENLTQFISTAFSDSEISCNELLEVVFERSKNESLANITQIVKGLFTASERIYFYENKHLFDEIEEQVGSAGVQFLLMGTMPYMAYDFIESLHEIFDDKSPFDPIIEKQKKFIPRNWKDRTEVIFVQKIVEQLSKDKLILDFNYLGEFLYWFHLPSLDNSKIFQYLNEIDWTEKISESNIQSTADFLLNLFHFVPNAYKSFIESYKDVLLGRYKLLTETIWVEERGKDIYIEFIVDESSTASEKPHEQTSKRLDILYKMFPTYERYCSKGLYPFDIGEERIFDDTDKEFPINDLQLKLNAHKNAIWENFGVPSIYNYQKQWFEFRRDAHKFIEKFIDMLQRASLGYSDNLESLIINEWATVRPQFSKIGRLPKKISERVKEAERKIFSWASSLQNFISQVVQFDNEESKRLCRYNLREAANHLDEAQKAFKVITNETQEYFNFSELDRDEQYNYLLLAEMLDVLYGKLNDFPIRNLKEYIKKRRKTENNKKLSEIKFLLKPLEENEFIFKYPKEPIINGNEISIIVGFEVTDFRFGIEQIGAIIDCLANISFNFWYLHIVPLLNGNTYQSKVWRISQNSINEIITNGKENAWALLPYEANETFLSHIPNNTPIEIVESQLITRFNALTHSLHIARRTRELLNNRLNKTFEYDNKLAKVYENNFSKQEETIAQEAKKLFDELKVFTTRLVDSEVSNNEKIAWTELIQLCLSKYKLGIENVSSPLSDDENKDFWSDREVEFLFGEYLNLKYNKT
jgi:hypothetical protein